MCDPNVVGTGGALGSPKGGDQKPALRSEGYAMYRCCECQLMRVHAADSICGECFDNKHPLKP